MSEIPTNDDKPQQVTVSDPSASATPSEKPSNITVPLAGPGPLAPLSERVPINPGPGPAQPKPNVEPIDFRPEPKK